MPFPNITKHGVERTFEQVLTAVFAQLNSALKLYATSFPDKDGWTLDDDLAALKAMVADSLQASP